MSHRSQSRGVARLFLFVNHLMAPEVYLCARARVWVCVCATVPKTRACVLDYQAFSFPHHFDIFVYLPMTYKHSTKSVFRVPSKRSSVFRQLLEISNMSFASGQITFPQIMT